MKDSQAIMTIVRAFTDGMCGCSGKWNSLTGHSVGCPVAAYRNHLKRLIKLAGKLDNNHPLSKRQFTQARCSP